MRLKAWHIFAIPAIFPQLCVRDLIKLYSRGSIGARSEVCHLKRMRER
jgi:hypothetical protein